LRRTIAQYCNNNSTTLHFEWDWTDVTGDCSKYSLIGDLCSKPVQRRANHPTSSWFRENPIVASACENGRQKIGNKSAWMIK